MKNEIEELKETNETYKSYVNTKRTFRAKRVATNILSIVLAALGFAYSYNQFSNAKNYSNEASEIAAIIRELEGDISKYQGDDEKIARLTHELEFQESLLENTNTMKTLSTVNIFASAAFALVILKLRKHLEKMIKQDMSNKKKNFYNAFLNEVIYFDTPSSREDFDTILSYFIRDVAVNENKTFDEVVVKINENEVFPEYESPYMNVCSYAHRYINSHDYRKQNRVVYDALPKAFLALSDYLVRNKISNKEFNAMSESELCDLFEKFMSEQFSAENSNEVPASQPAV